MWASMLVQNDWELKTQGELTLPCMLFSKVFYQMPTRKTGGRSGIWREPLFLWPRCARRDRLPLQNKHKTMPPRPNSPLMWGKDITPLGEGSETKPLWTPGNNSLLLGWDKLITTYLMGREGNFLGPRIYQA